MKTMKEGNLIKLLTALSIIGAFDFVVYSLVFIEIPEGNREIFIHLMGIIEGCFVTSLVGYYYTRSSKAEDKGDTELGQK